MTISQTIGDAASPLDIAMLVSKETLLEAGRKLAARHRALNEAERKV